MSKIRHFLFSFFELCKFVMCCGAASLDGNTAVAKMLIQHGADANRKDREGKTVLMVCQ